MDKDKIEKIVAAAGVVVLIFLLLSIFMKPKRPSVAPSPVLSPALSTPQAVMPSAAVPKQAPKSAIDTKKLVSLAFG